MFYAAGLVTGVIIGYFICSFINYLNKGIDVTLLGYKLSVHRKDKLEVINTKEKYRKLHF